MWETKLYSVTLGVTLSFMSRIIKNTLITKKKKKNTLFAVRLEVLAAESVL
jgi:hypothetical protein